MVEGGGGDFTCGTNLLLNLRDQDVHTHKKKRLHGGTCALKESLERKFTTTKKPNYKH